MSETICRKCGGTGDKWNTSLDDWVTPRKPCQECKGTGSVEVDGI